MFPEHLRPYLLLNQKGARLTMSVMAELLIQLVYGGKNIF
jgi:hypothetical protein